MQSQETFTSRPVVQSEALSVARSLGNDQFKACTHDGWIVLRRGTILC
jgi:hypothetical protein